jgi:hypothetical protein
MWSTGVAESGETQTEDSQRWHPDPFRIGTIWDGTDPDAAVGLGSMTEFLERERAGEEEE